MPKGYPKTEEGRKRQRENLAKGAFKKGQTTNPKGRPPKTMTAFVREMKAKGYEVPSSYTIAESFLYLATLPEEELKAILTDKTRPMMQRIIAKGVLDKKGLDVLDRIIDRAYGKVQHIDLTTQGEKIQQDPLQVHVVTSSEEYAKVLAEIQKEKQIKEQL